MDYIYTGSSLDKSLCETIIQKFELDFENKYNGVIAKGVDKNVKDTTDMIIPETNEWKEINDCLASELKNHMMLYLEQIQKGENYKSENNHGATYTHLESMLLQESNFMIQKYDKQKGKYVYHTDASFDENKTRVITYLWYLNDVVEGGETEFFGGSFKITPEAGKLLLFPALWSYPHRGNMPISSHKYIITGWLYKYQPPKKLHIPSIIVKDSIEPETKIAFGKQKLVFEYFYKHNLSIFMDYKHTHETGKSTLESINVNTYTPMICNWIIDHIMQLTERTSIDSIPDIMTTIVSSIEILINNIKNYYKISCDINIKNWYILQNKEEVFEKDYDLCIQTDLSSGISYIGTEYKHIDSNFKLVYFLDYNFIYLDGEENKLTLSLKDIADPCMEFIV